MLFRRKSDVPASARLRRIVWPDGGWRRTGAYVAKRAMRINATPHAIAAGLACGALSSFTPFLGFHFLLAFGLAALLGGNMLAAALGTAVGNPLTFPFIWAFSYKVGRTALGTPAEAGASEPVSIWADGFWAGGLAALEPLVPMIVGGMILGLPLAVTIYIVARSGVGAFQERRRARLQRARSATGLRGRRRVAG